MDFPAPAVVAVDGGNSKTDLALVAADGTLLACVRGQGMPVKLAPYDIIARGYGPSGPAWRKTQPGKLSFGTSWARPGAQDLELSAWPPGARPETFGGASIVIDRPHVPPRRAMADVVTAPIED